MASCNGAITLGKVPTLAGAKDDWRVKHDRSDAFTDAHGDEQPAVVSHCDEHVQKGCTNSNGGENPVQDADDDESGGDPIEGSTAYAWHP